MDHLFREDLEALLKAEELEDSSRVQALAQIAEAMRKPLHRVFAMFDTHSGAEISATLTRLFHKGTSSATSEEEFLTRMGLLGRLAASLSISKQTMRGFFSCLRTCDAVELLRGLRLLQMLLNSSTEQFQYFYFSGARSGLQIKIPGDYPFTSGFACCFWVRCEPEETHALPRLFTIYSQFGFGVECYLDGRNLWYRSLHGDYIFPDANNPGVKVGELSAFDWDFVVIEHQKHRLKKDLLKVRVNDIEVHMELPFKQKGQGYVTCANIGTDFSGQIQAAVFLKSGQPSARYQELRDSSVDQWINNPRVLGKDTVVLLHPERLGCRSDLNFLQGSGVTPPRRRRMAELGGLEVLIPLLQLGKETHSEEMLTEWLKLVIICITCESQVDLERTSFFTATAQCFAELPPTVFAAHHIMYLEQLEKQLIMPVKLKFVKELLWAFDVWLHTSEEVLHRQLKVLTDLYVEQGPQLIQVFGPEEIYKILAEHLSSLELYSEWVLLSLLTIIETLAFHDATALEELLKIVVITGSERIKQKALYILLGALKASATTHAGKDLSETVVEKYGNEVLVDCLQKSVDTNTILLALQCVSHIIESQNRSRLNLNSSKTVAFINATLLPTLAVYQQRSTPRELPGETESTATFTDFLELIEELKAVPNQNGGRLDTLFIIAKQCSLPDQLEIAKFCYDELQQDPTLTTLFCRTNSWYDWFLMFLNKVPEEDQQVLEPLLNLHTHIFTHILVTEETGWMLVKESFSLIETYASQSPSVFLLLVENLRCRMQLSIDAKEFRRFSIVWRNLAMLSFAIQECLSSKISDDSNPLLVLNQLTRLLHTEGKVESGATQWLNGVNSQVEALQTDFSALQSQAANAADELRRCRQHVIKKILKRVSGLRGAWHYEDPEQFEMSSKSNREHGKFLLKPSSNSSYRIKPQSKVETQEFQLPMRMRIESVDSAENEDDLSVESDESRWSHSISSSKLDSSSFAGHQKNKVTVTVGWILPVTTRPGFLQIVNIDKYPVVQFLHDEFAAALLGIELCDYTHPLDEPSTVNWKVRDLIEVIPKTYIMRHTAAEFIFADGQTVTMNFASQAERRHFMEQLRKLVHKGVVRFPLFRKHQPHKLVRHFITERWRNWEMSNFEYLMYLNSMAGRSFNDLTQYCVMPWVLADYSSPTLNLSDPGVYRDLSLNMGSCGTESRKESLWSRYKHSFGPEDVPYFFGSHYSSPGIVLNFLLRLMPYSEGAKALQGGTFDIPDRLFKNIQSSFISALEDGSDVRELIPEFFCNPEFLINRNRLDLGVTQEGDTVDQVELPSWAATPYEFIRLNRLALESDFVSSKLHEWIDLIFGCKQRGKEAVKHMNVFHIMTYEGTFDLDREQNPQLRKAYEAQIAHFGRTPSQLFREAHRPRKALEEICPWHTVLSSHAQLRPTFAPTRKQKKAHYSISVTGIWVDQDCTKFHIARGNDTIAEYLIELASVQSAGPYCISFHKEHSLSSGTGSQLDSVDSSIKSQPTIFLSNGTILLQGGFWGGSMLYAYQRKSKLHRTKWDWEWIQAHGATVSCIDVTHSESIVITGATDGSVSVWEHRNHRLELLWEFFDHDDATTSVAVDESLHLFSSCSRDGTCNLYSLSSGRLVTTVYVCSEPSHLLFEPAAPAKILLISRAERKVVSYSLTGDLILEREIEDSVSCAIVVRDMTYNEFLVYGTEFGSVKVASTSDLTCLHEISLDRGAHVSALSLSRDNLIIVAGLDNGELAAVVDSQSIVKLMEKRMQDVHHALSL